MTTHRAHVAREPLRRSRATLTKNNPRGRGAGEVLSRRPEGECECGRRVYMCCHAHAGSITSTITKLYIVNVFQFLRSVRLVLLAAARLFLFLFIFLFFSHECTHTHTHCPTFPPLVATRQTPEKGVAIEPRMLMLLPLSLSLCKCVCVLMIVVVVVVCTGAVCVWW